MTDIYVKNNMLTINAKQYQCAFGKNGFTDSKVEGDNKTPLGIHLIRRVFYRDDKIAPPICGGRTPIIIDDTMGWSDDIGQADYNTLITFPYAHSAEKMYRDDDVYDVVVELGYNDNPPIAGHGSAIFFHIARDGYIGTEGCIAVSLNDMLEILPQLTNDSVMHIST